MFYGLRQNNAAAYRIVSIHDRHARKQDHTLRKFKPLQRRYDFTVEYALGKLLIDGINDIHPPEIIRFVVRCISIIAAHANGF